MRLKSLLLTAALGLGCAFIAGCDSGTDDAVRLYQTAPHAPALSEDAIAASDHLGAVLVDQGANFSVYSERATRLEILLFDDPESDRPTRRIPMVRIGDVWSVYVEGVGRGQHYGYVAWGPNWPYDDTWYPGSIIGFVKDVDEAGNRFNPNKLLMDPYAVALHRDHDWTKGSLASGPDRTVLTWGAAAKSVVVQSRYEWSEAEHEWISDRLAGNPRHGPNEAIIYEVQLKGMTMSTASGVLHPGTYRGAGELAPYLADLGITTVEFLPVMEKPLDGTYWGYNTISFFAPEVSFASQREQHEVIDEFKWMVDQMHQHGVEVLLDVVYNHTGEGGFWRSKIVQDDISLSGNVALVNHDAKEVASIYSFRGLDNNAYYILDDDDPAFYTDMTGVGNTCRTDYGPMKRLVMDSLRYWVEEMHVDGFRFDLAPALGTLDDNPGEWDGSRTVLQDIADDPVLQAHQIRIIAEPWSLWHYKLGDFPVSTTLPDYAWSEWNANFRDVWRSFVNYDDTLLTSAEGPIDIGASLTGSAALFSDDGRKPYHSVNFITAHDGFTLFDLLSYNEKRNNCGPLNPVCCADPSNPFCETDSGDNHNRSRDWADAGEPFKRQMARNLFVAMLIAHGTPMLLGGDEWLRTQLGNNNAYSTSADNAFNWFDWGAWQGDDARVRMHDFVRKMIAFRRSHLYAFAPLEYGEALFAWKDEHNQDLADWNRRFLMQHYYDTSRGPQLLVLLNMDVATTVEFTLPGDTVWRRVVDTQQWFDGDDFIEGAALDARTSHNIAIEGAADPEPITGQYGVNARSIVILEELQ